MPCRAMPIAVGGPLNVSEWVQNCLQLSGYYVNANAYAVAEHCVRAAEAVAKQQAEAGQPVRRLQVGRQPLCRWLVHLLCGWGGVGAVG